MYNTSPDAYFISLVLISQQTKIFSILKLNFRCFVPMAAVWYSGPIQKLKQTWSAYGIYEPTFQVWSL